MVQYMDNKSSGFNAWMQQKDSGKKSKSGSFWIWILIFLAAWWLFSSWLTPKKVENKPGAVTEIGMVEDLTHVPVDVMQSDKISLAVQGARIYDISLKDYQATKNTGGASDDENVQLLSQAGEFVEYGLLANGTAAPTPETVWRAAESENGKRYTWKNADGIEFERNISVENYVITIRDSINNKSTRDVSFAPYARIVKSEVEKSQAGVAAGGISFVNSKIKREGWRDISKKAYAFQTDSGFVGFETQYWEAVLQISAPDQTIRMKQRGDGMYQVDSAASAIAITAGKSASLETKIFAGPKTQNVLNTAAGDIAGINQTIDYGWFWFLARPFLWALNWLFAFVGNYGIAIILLTLILRGLMWPLTKKSFTSMSAMQKLQPELQRVQKLYANDKVRLQQEMMKVYQANKTSPMGGCLPMLLQIPIFFALYKALLISVPMRQAGFLWISDLAAPDPTSVFNLFGLLPYAVPSWLMIGVLPVLMGATMWLQQYLQARATGNAAAADKNNPLASSMKFMKWMPVIFVFMFAWMPAGLVLYWTVSNIFGIVQMWIIRKK